MKETYYTYINVRSGEISRDYDTVEAWELNEGALQFLVKSKVTRTIACCFDSFKEAWNYLMRHDEFCEVSIIETEAML